MHTRVRWGIWGLTALMACESAESNTPPPDAQVLQPDPDAQAFLPDPDARASVPDPDAQVFPPDPDAQVVPPDPDAGAPAPDARVVEPDARALTPDAAVAPAVLTGLSPAALAEALPTRDFLLINVHVPDAGQIPGTDVHITYTDTPALMAYIGDDRDRAALVYCLTDHMALIAGNALVAEGYRHITYLEGGMRAWEAAGYPLEPTP
jgi:rhodanese-related sulfurtransferase